VVDQAGSTSAFCLALNTQYRIISFDAEYLRNGMRYRQCIATEC